MNHAAIDLAEYRPRRKVRAGRPAPRSSFGTVRRLFRASTPDEREEFLQSDLKALEPLPTRKDRTTVWVGAALSVSLSALLLLTLIR